VTSRDRVQDFSFNAASALTLTPIGTSVCSPMPSWRRWRSSPETLACAVVTPGTGGAQVAAEALHGAGVVAALIPCRDPAHLPQHRPRTELYLTFHCRNPTI
jgi:hypothetical protein